MAAIMCCLTEKGFLSHVTPAFLLLFIIIFKIAGLKRGGKSCRLRWKNYLRPDIKRGGMSEEEEDLIIRLHKLLGNRCALIYTFFLMLYSIYNARIHPTSVFNKMKPF